MKRKQRNSTSNPPCGSSCAALHRVEISMAVEVTGPRRQPIYARGWFDHNGGYSDGNPSLWRVSLSTLNHCPLSHLRNVEVWICGSQQTHLSMVVLWKVNSQLLLEMGFRPFPSCHLYANLGSFEDLDARNLNFVRDRHNVLDYVCETLAQAERERYCEFTYIYDHVRYFQPLVQSVPVRANLSVLTRESNSVWNAVWSLYPQVNLDRFPQILFDMLMNEIRDDNVDLQRREVLDVYLLEMRNFIEEYLPELLS